MTSNILLLNAVTKSKSTTDDFMTGEKHTCNRCLNDKRDVSFMSNLDVWRIFIDGVGRALYLILSLRLTSWIQKQPFYLLKPHLWDYTMYIVVWPPEFLQPVEGYVIFLSLLYFLAPHWYTLIKYFTCLFFFKPWVLWVSPIPWSELRSTHRKKASKLCLKPKLIGIAYLNQLYICFDLFGPISFHYLEMRVFLDKLEFSKSLAYHYMDKM